MPNPLPVGLIVPPYGRIIAVRNTGNRVYWVASDRGIELVSADKLERGKYVTKIPN